MVDSKRKLAYKSSCEVPSFLTCHYEVLRSWYLWGAAWRDSSGLPDHLQPGHSKDPSPNSRSKQCGTGFLTWMEAAYLFQITEFKILTTLHRLLGIVRNTTQNLMKFHSQSVVSLEISLSTFSLQWLFTTRHGQTSIGQSRTTKLARAADVKLSKSVLAKVWWVR